MTDSNELALCHHHMRTMGSLIGHVLSTAVPPVVSPDTGGAAVAIPGEHVEDLVECFQLVIAEALQSWIDAGSERDVTMENDELFIALRNELRGWSTLWNTPITDKEAS